MLLLTREIRRMQFGNFLSVYVI